MAAPLQERAREATYADLLAVPSHLVAELLRGKLVTHPRPAPRHSSASSVLGGILINPFQLGVGGPAGWIFMDEPELHLGENVASPDIAGWRIDRLTELPTTSWIETPPDWICEVLSPSTEAYDRGEKREIYAEAKVPHLWFVEPRLQMLEIFELQGNNWLLTSVVQGSQPVCQRPFEAIEFSLGYLWPFDKAGRINP